MKEKLCYVLPEYNPLTSEHYYHIYEFLEDVSRQLDIFLVIEKSTGRPEVKGIEHIYTMKLAMFPLNLVERLFVFSCIRWRGYRKFYVHYSYSGAIIASIVTRVFGGRTLYWNCVLKRDFMVKWQFSLPVLKKKFFDDWAFLLTLKLTDYLVTGSEFMREYFASEFSVPKAKIKVMPNWVNLERFSPVKYDRERIRQELNLDAGARVVLFVHWLAPRKGPQYLVSIARETIRDIPDVVFLILGEGPYKETLRREIGESGLEGRMRLVGGVPNQEIPKYYAAADLFIMPSQQEEFGRVLIEAMAMGVPIVASDTPGPRQVLTAKQAEYIAPVSDIGAFARKMVEILTDDRVSEALKKEGRERAKDFAKEVVADRFAKVIVGRVLAGT